MSRLSKMMTEVKLPKNHPIYNETLCTWVLLTGDSSWYCSKRTCYECSMKSTGLSHAELVKAYDEVNYE